VIPSSNPSRSPDTHTSLSVCDRHGKRVSKLAANGLISWTDPNVGFRVLTHGDLSYYNPTFWDRDDWDREYIGRWFSISAPWSYWEGITDPIYFWAWDGKKEQAELCGRLISTFPFALEDVKALSFTETGMTLVVERNPRIMISATIERREARMPYVVKKKRATREN